MYFLCSLWKCTTQAADAKEASRGGARLRGKEVVPPAALLAGVPEARGVQEQRAVCAVVNGHRVQHVYRVGRKARPLQPQHGAPARACVQRPERGQCQQRARARPRAPAALAGHPTCSLELATCREASLSEFPAAQARASFVTAPSQPKAHQSGPAPAVALPVALLGSARVSIN